MCLSSNFFDKHNSLSVRFFCLQSKKGSGGWGHVDVTKLRTRQGPLRSPKLLQKQNNGTSLQPTLGSHGLCPDCVQIRLLRYTVIGSPPGRCTIKKTPPKHSHLNLPHHQSVPGHLLISEQGGPPNGVWCQLASERSRVGQKSIFPGVGVVCTTKNTKKHQKW